MAKRIFHFPKIDKWLSVDLSNADDRELLAEYRDYNRRVNQWHHKKKKLRPAVIKRDGECLNCGATDNLVADHIIPLRRGGENKIENLQTLCWSCNSKKASKDRVAGKARRK